MTAIPLKMNKIESAISPMFGHAKWFAFVSDDGEIEIERNPYDGGMPVVEWLLGKGVRTIVTSHIGAGPFRFFLQQGIRAYHPGEGRVVLIEALDGLRDGRLMEITPENIAQFALHSGHHH
jgi:predicted Fe-Mo cluster-binding NifX family protein